MNLPDKEEIRLTKQMHLAHSLGVWATNKNKGDVPMLLKLRELHLNELCGRVFNFMAGRKISFDKK